MGGLLTDLVGFPSATLVCKIITDVVCYSDSELYIFENMSTILYVSSRCSSLQILGEVMIAQVSFFLHCNLIASYISMQTFIVTGVTLINGLPATKKNQIPRCGIVHSLFHCPEFTGLHKKKR